MGWFDRISGVLKEPPPSMAFEVSEAGIAVARLRPRGEPGFVPLKAGVISVSPLRDNIVDPDGLSTAVRAASRPASRARYSKTIR